MGSRFRRAFAKMAGNDIGVPFCRLSANLSVGLVLRSKRVFSPMADRARLVRLITIGLISCVVVFAHGSTEPSFRGNAGNRSGAVSAERTETLTRPYQEQTPWYPMGTVVVIGR